MSVMGFMVFLGGVLSILMNRGHVLILLLCLEFMYLGIMFCIFVGMSVINFNINVILLMFFIVCEGGLGLSILVGAVYFYGNDKVSSVLLVKC
uniref:NADH dehydrogenase subunit 4L n=1 Tax=Alectorobius peropteryx TaxID=1265610 RepID=UPI002237BA6D|nr:NADH dehydrogenase subunit 4L [Alectorobius peropteryx]UYB78505.1 NADH dehydrogenase subunit 4L [Alectorobius peropteryx]UYB78518.1 NADH dehydrogenase subunit 4L [Alectorobius peropteryx]